MNEILHKDRQPFFIGHPILYKNIKITKDTGVKYTYYIWKQIYYVKIYTTRQQR